MYLPDVTKRPVLDYSEFYGGDWTDASTGKVTRVCLPRLLKRVRFIKLTALVFQVAIKALRGITHDEGELVKIRRVSRPCIPSLPQQLSRITKSEATP